MGLWLLAAPAGAGSHTAGEYELKAAFLLNFARLVQWPATALREPEAPFTIGVFADDPFDGALRSLVEGETVDGRPLRVREVHSLAQARSCQILFVPASQSERVEELRRGLEGAAVLVVGEASGFARRGGSINFYPESGRLRFEVNRAEAQRAGLRLSSRLLRLARLVESGGG